MRRTYLIALVALFSPILMLAQPQSSAYWQQRGEYEMEIDMDVTTHKFQGKQKLTYYNNSPDTLNKVYYHLYFNAFQPGSMMDVRSLSIADPDRRVGDRISKLSDDEIGYQHIESLKQNGKAVTYKVEGTILEVRLNKPIMPNDKAVFKMEFEGQVPVQIRRSGRDNAEGISYSMSQWYPKMAEYDYLGWHTNPYIGREFHGLWSDFDVKLTIDQTYTVGGTGYLQNANDIGHGYAEGEGKPKNGKLTWHFKAPNVIDFMWAADPDYKHTTAQVPNGPTLHFFYQETEENQENWAKLPEMMVQAFEYLNKNFGKYPYDQYSFIQGGDGGMEYPMATLITGNRNFNSLLGVSVHEAIHSWYQGVLATNESLYPWMDEGFTSYASDEVMKHLLNPDSDSDPHTGSYRNYFFQASSGNEEALTTHSDHYNTNRSYGINSYSKGAVFLHQLSYIIGQETFMKGMRRYYNTWKFKHPTSVDFIRVMEKASGMQLDWYLEHFVYSTNQIDYGIKTILGSDDATYVTLERVKNMMMPIDLYVEYEDGSREIYYIPLRIMRGAKDVEDQNVQRMTLEEWPWTNPSYTLKINRKASEIKSIEIDASERMADIERA
ncbi:M1 family peptidase, partial [Fulvivirga sp. RKSG066]|uniref:M1 family metallopeptidase n=1 Tax=Fulvivirga aurantia TaxID=2529383 RepID=UPI0012BC2AAE